MVFKSLNGLALQYLCELFTRNTQCSTHTPVIPTMMSDCQTKSLQMGKNVFRFGEQNYGIASRPSPKRLPLLAASNPLFRNEGGTWFCDGTPVALDWQAGVKRFVF